MKTIFKTLIIISMLVCPFLVFAQMAQSTYHLPMVDIQLEKSQQTFSSSGPLKFAVPTRINDVYYLDNKASAGQWQQLSNGSWLWQFRMQAKNATSLNVGFTDFFLPHSAEMLLFNDNKTILKGPFNDTANQNHGFFWSGLIEDDHVNIEIRVSDKEKKYLSFNIDNVTRGFFRFWQESFNKSGSCNVDVACPEGDDWQADISSVGRYIYATDSGSFLCTGQLINNTANDGTPYFLTADHCGYSNTGVQVSLADRQNVAASISVTWNYQSLTCRTPGSAASGTQISTAGFNDTQTGASYVASNPLSDFALVRLNQTPDDDFAIEYSGWDRRDIAPNG
ncbi:MAG: hypothetical protein L3J52_00685, partial [Proteobacteria bacterium]|nr:hypothetical protein [Pseudomonadota bacterium]